MKYIYHISLKRENECVYDGPSEMISEDYCSDYIKAMEAAKDAMKFIENCYAGEVCFDEIHKDDEISRKVFGHVRTWKAITDSIYVIRLTKIKLDNKRIRLLG